MLRADFAIGPNLEPQWPQANALNTLQRTTWAGASETRSNVSEWE